MDNCGLCHVLHNPNQFTSSSWINITNEMFPNTKLNEDEQSKVLKYPRPPHEMQHSRNSLIYNH
ncbi:hypothetical protein [Photobacterium phosphoreum]|uniref:hypothetical protein n=1 Tax=Photobacterium phosphoreum TaxID=659 RepID=UPI000D1671D0